MATLAAGNLTLLDAAKRLDPNGSVADIAEMLSQMNDVLEDAVFVEGNLPTGHRVSIRTGLPAVYFRQIGAGIPTSKSTTAQVDEPTSLLEAYSEIDTKLLALNGNDASFRMSEDVAFIESLNQQQVNTLFYGNVGVDAKTYTGLATRYSTISGAGNAQNIIDAGGTGSVNTSMYLVGWSPRTVFCTYPKGSKAGLTQTDLGVDTVIDANGGRFQAYRTHFVWENGLVVKDWRYAVRAANVDTTNLVTESSAANIVKIFVKMIARLPNFNGIRPAFYVNRTVWEMLMIQALNASGGGNSATGTSGGAGALSVTDAVSQFGTTQKTLKFLGFPIRIVDQLLNTETRVV
jgi:hypothetical protein